MQSLYLLIPLGLLVVLGAVLLFIHAVNDGQFDDLGEQQRRMPDDS